MSFQDQVVLVTGAGRGIGKAIALAFARDGAKVAVNDINPSSCEAVAQEIRSGGGEAAAFHADVSNKLAVQAMLIDLEDRWGRVDVLINNAGVEPHKPIVQLDEWDWDRTIDVNLKGAFICAQSVGRMMIKQDGGVIVNIASIAGRAAGLRDRSAYVASKTGLIGFTKECAREFAAHQIRVNAVCPGVIVTEMTAHLRDNEAQLKKWLEDIPLGRLGEPDDVTGLVLFLCSDAARYITGQAINIDGGKVML
ncbi:MAG: SDR family oxidoreductase [Thermoflexales bacterium]|nr:SDR family oxidoreductase [Thermoflexales bacterium]